jgi:hypothetical protein
MSTLDSLYGFIDISGNSNVSMTYYHGPAIPQGAVFSGFNLWYFQRAQCQALVDFVLQNLWGMSRVGVVGQTPADGGAAPRARASRALRDRRGAGAGD